MNDSDLLAHYLERGHEAWNTSLAASWLDYELRAGVLARLPAQRPLTPALACGDQSRRGRSADAVVPASSHSREECFGAGPRPRPNGSSIQGHHKRAQGLDVCNVGIGVGLFDDWLGHVIGAPITSVDSDRDICTVFELRQQRERHPHPARVLCGNAVAVLPAASFDVITCVGSTLREAVDRGALRGALLQALRPDGTLILADVRSEPDGSIVVELDSLGADGRMLVPSTVRALRGAATNA